MDKFKHKIESIVKKTMEKKSTMSVEDLRQELMVSPGLPLPTVVGDFITLPD